MSLELKELKENEIVLYSKARCPRCKKAKLWFRLRGIEYTEINTDTSPEYLDVLISKGYMSLPVISSKEGEFSFTQNNEKLFTERFGEI